MGTGIGEMYLIQLLIASKEIRKGIIPYSPKKLIYAPPNQRKVRRL